MCGYVHMWYEHDFTQGSLLCCDNWQVYAVDEGRNVLHIRLACVAESVAIDRLILLCTYVCMYVCMYMLIKIYLSGKNMVMC